jgi:hypothetical protein
MAKKEQKVKRPMTVREMQAAKQKMDRGTITIYNCSKQMVPIHLDAPKGVDFYVGATDVRLKPGQTHKFKKNRIRMPQIERLRKQGFVQVLHDSEKYAEKKEQAEALASKQ